MRMYIENLTSHLIRKNNYDSCIGRIKGRMAFIKFVALSLANGDVLKMTPQKLGQILSEFEVGDVMATKMEIFDIIHFDGNCEAMFRELVATCLAFVIYCRLTDDSVWVGSVLPRYER